MRSRRQKLDLFKRFFSGLTNTYGTYDPENGRSWQVKQPVTDDVLLSHLLGRQPYGVYLLEGDRIKSAAVDFDTKDRTLPLEFVHRVNHFRMKAYIERSKSKGYHVWIFFEKKGVKASKVRVVMANILEELDAGNYEIFPKHDSLSPSVPYGNFINAPLYGKLVPAGKTLFLDPNTFEPYADQWAFLESIEPADEELLDSLIQTNQWGFPYSRPVEDSSTFGRSPSTDFGLPPCAKKMLLHGVDRYQRVCCFRLAVHLKRIGLPYDLAVAALKVWSLKNHPVNDKRVITEQEILTQTRYAYEHDYRGCGCESEAVALYCQTDCPVGAKIEHSKRFTKNSRESQ